MLPSVSFAQASQYLYVGDYDGKAVHRFNAITGALDNATYITFSSGVEGMGGVGSNLFVASGNSIYQYDISGATPSLVKQFGSNTQTLQMALSNDGHYLYAAQSNQISRYDLYQTDPSVGAISKSTPNSWGVAVAKDGTVYVNNGWSAKGNVGIQKFDQNLTTLTDLRTKTAAAADGFTAGAGLTFDSSGNLWAVNGGNADQNNGFANEYNTTTGALLRTVSFGSGVNRPFGAALGYNGDIFVSSQGSNGCVLEVHNQSYNTTNPQYSVTTFVTVTTSGTNNTLKSAKTIYFSSQFVAGAPEPSNFVFGGTFGLGLIVMILRKRYKRHGTI